MNSQPAHRLDGLRFTPLPRIVWRRVWRGAIARALAFYWLHRKALPFSSTPSASCRPQSDEDNRRAARRHTAFCHLP